MFSLGSTLERMVQSLVCRSWEVNNSDMDSQDTHLGVRITQTCEETGAEDQVWPSSVMPSPIGSKRVTLGLSEERERTCMSSMGLNPDSPSFTPPVEVPDKL